jgi:hypothetical protein
MAPKRIYLVLLGAAAISIICRTWKIPDILTLGLTLAGVTVLLAGPGLMLLGVSRKRAPAQSIHLIWIAVTGPLVLSAVALLAWFAGGIVRPELICRGAVIALIAGCLAWTSREPPDLRLSVSECNALLIALLVILVAAGRSVHSLGVQGELYGGTITRTFEADGRSDPRVPFLIPINVANHWNPFAPESQAFYSPYTFTSRGPLVGLMATPAVLTWGLTRMQTIGQMGEPFQPVDRYGYMQYRFAIIALGALAVVPFFVALGGGELALAGTAIYALSPFLIHEVYFTWTKQATVPFILSAFCLVLAQRPGLAGLLVGFAYLAHPSAAFTGLAFVPFLVALQRQSDWREVSAANLLHPSRWWQARGSIAAFVAGTACALLPWWAYSHDKFNPGGFGSYIFLADGQSDPEAWEWIMSRIHSLASTLVPLYSYLNFHDHPLLQPVAGPALPLVTFSTQYFYTLPAGVGFVWFFSRFRQLGRSLRRSLGFALIMVGLPSAHFWVHWGATVIGLMREGLQAQFAFLMLAWVQFIPPAKLNRPWLNLARALELLIFIWVPTIVSHSSIASANFVPTDLLGLLVTIAAVLLLARFTWTAPEYGAISTAERAPAIRHADRFSTTDLK